MNSRKCHTVFQDEWFTNKKMQVMDSQNQKLKDFTMHSLPKRN